MAGGVLWRGKRLWRLARTDLVEAGIDLCSCVAEISELGQPRFQQCPYAVTADWERRLHESLGATWPCNAASEFWPLWAEVLESFRTKQVSIGRGAFAGWGDGEPGLTRAVWCLVRHLKPRHVVETGVARGFTSRIILEALERNGAGSLYSIDLPPPLNPELHDQIGMAVPAKLQNRWSYLKGSSRRHLPRLLADLGSVDLFIHDSAHTEYNTNFELKRAWSSLRPSGVMVADDIDSNWGFRTFMQANPGHGFIIYHAEPLAPDPIRFDAKGLIGIAVKNKA